jgi:hypothetical protein
VERATKTRARHASSPYGRARIVGADGADGVSVRACPHLAEGRSTARGGLRGRQPGGEGHPDRTARPTQGPRCCSHRSGPRPDPAIASHPGRVGPARGANTPEPQMRLIFRLTELRPWGPSEASGLIVDGRGSDSGCGRHYPRPGVLCREAQQPKVARRPDGSPTVTVPGRLVAPQRSCDRRSSGFRSRTTSSRNNGGPPNPPAQLLLARSHPRSTSVTFPTQGSAAPRVGTALPPGPPGFRPPGLPLSRRTVAGAR